MSYQQVSIWDGTTPLKINKPIRLIELFAGIGAQAKALERLGVPFEHYRICEFDEYAVTSYNAIHGTNFQPSDIRNITGTELGVVDTDKFTYIMTYSFPCFTADSLVLTSGGYKRIAEVKVGDKVLTHDNTYQTVLRTFNNGNNEILRISAMCADEIKCTPNHKFYVRNVSRKGHLQKRMFDEPQWKRADELTANDYLGVAINQKEIIPEWDGVDFVWKDGRKTRHKNEIQSLLGYQDFWWIIGRYMGDGWIRTQGGIIICCEAHEVADLQRIIGKYFRCSVVKERTICKIHIPLKEMSAFVSQFGRGAANKHLTNAILDLPRQLLKGFIDGYMSADGCYIHGRYSACSVSRELIYGIAQCVAKVFRVSYRIYKRIPAPKGNIEGRIINQKPLWEIVYKLESKKQDHAFFENGYIWCPIRKIEPLGTDEVYDIMVENNHSFTVQNVIVHNCQDLSLAGNQAGMHKGGGTRSGLLWEVEWLLKDMSGYIPHRHKPKGKIFSMTPWEDWYNPPDQTKLPQILLMENVPQVIGQKNVKDFAEWVAFLDELGYTSKWAVLNAKDFNVPQNRERCYMVSWLGDHSYFFPTGTGCKRQLKDVLEKQVDEKYYLSEKGLEYVSQREGRYTQLCNDKTKIAPSAVTANGNKNWTGNFIADRTTPRYSKTVRAGGRGSLDRHCWDIVVESGEVIVYDDYNSRVRADQNSVGTLTTNCGSSSKRNGLKIIEGVWQKKS